MWVVVEEFKFSNAEAQSEDCTPYFELRSRLVRRTDCMVKSMGRAPTTKDSNYARRVRCCGEGRGGSLMAAHDQS